jgi:hypothetical protein
VVIGQVEEGEQVEEDLLRESCNMHPCCCVVECSWMRMEGWKEGRKEVTWLNE